MIFRKKSEQEEIIKEIEKRVKRYAGKLGIFRIKLEVNLIAGYYKIGVPERANGEKREKLNQLLEADPFLSSLHIGPVEYMEK